MATAQPGTRAASLRSMSGRDIGLWMLNLYGLSGPLLAVTVGAVNSDTPDRWFYILLTILLALLSLCIPAIVVCSLLHRLMLKRASWASKRAWLRRQNTDRVKRRPPGGIGLLLTCILSSIIHVVGLRSWW